MNIGSLVTALAVGTALEGLLLLGGYQAHTEGWFWPLDESARAHYAPRVTHFFTFSEHWGVRCLVVLNCILAYAVTTTHGHWNLPLFFIVLLLMCGFNLVMMQWWAAGDNNPAQRVLSAFNRDGLFAAPGVWFIFSMAAAYAIAAMYFLTPGPVNRDFALIFAIALTAQLAAGLLQPPYRVWGEIHEAAWWQTAGMMALVWILFLVRTEVMTRF